MNKFSLVSLFSFILCCYSLIALGNEVLIDEERARYNYVIFCQGCHLPDAGGSDYADVPAIKNYIGNFLNVAGGREFLIRVPGSANSVLDDLELAELMNWMVLEFSGESMPDNFQHYTAAEVGDLRKNPLNEVTNLRAGLVNKISSLKQ